MGKKPSGSSQDKGDVLELAVQIIETAILRASPNIKVNALSISPKKRIKVDGVGYEIDLWVEIDSAPGYRSVFIFECKNREDRVDKTQIGEFERAISASRAQRGFFVAKSFDSGARARAALNPLLELLEFSEDVEAIAHLMWDYCFFLPSSSARRLSLSPAPPGPVDYASVVVLPEGAALSLAIYTEHWMTAVLRDALSPENGFTPLLDGGYVSMRPPMGHKFPPRTYSVPEERLAAGDHELVLRSQRHFPAMPLLVAGAPVNLVTLEVSLAYTVVRPDIIAGFDVASRGKLVRYAPYLSPGGLEYTINAVNAGEGTIGVMTAHNVGAPAEPKEKHDAAK